MCLFRREKNGSSNARSLMVFFSQMKMTKTEIIIHSDQVVCVREWEKRRRNHHVHHKLNRHFTCKSPKWTYFFFYLTPIGILLHCPKKPKPRQTLWIKNDEIFVTWLILNAFKLVITGFNTAYEWSFNWAIICFFSVWYAHSVQQYKAKQTQCGLLGIRAYLTAEKKDNDL